MKEVTCAKCPLFARPVPKCDHGAHYNVYGQIDMERVKHIFPDASHIDSMNWIVASTSGIHGMYTTLDEIEKGWDITNDEDEEWAGRELTVLIIHPRLVCLKYGVIEIETKEDIAYLRGLINASMIAIKESQEGNL